MKITPSTIDAKFTTNSIKQGFAKSFKTHLFQKYNEVPITQ